MTPYIAAAADPQAQCAAVLIGQAQLSGSLRSVKSSITRRAACPGSGAVSQVWIGANSQASGLSVPPARRCRRY